MVLMRPFRLASAALIAGSSLITSTGLLAPVRADTVARANGRCLLRQDGYEAFNGHCTVKQKQNGGTTIFVVDLDNGSRYRFSGPNRQQLQVETPSGLQANVLFQDQGSKGLFSWTDGARTYRLAVKTDVVTNPNAQFDDHPSASVGQTLATAAVGALLSALISGGRSSGGAGAVGQPVPELQNLIGADPGYVESRLTGAGYTYIRSTPSENGMTSFWRRGGSCVDVRSVLNRYQSFTYANPASCR